MRPSDFHDFAPAFMNDPAACAEVQKMFAFLKEEAYKKASAMALASILEAPARIEAAIQLGRHEMLKELEATLLAARKV